MKNILVITISTLLISFAASAQDTKSPKPKIKSESQLVREQLIEKLYLEKSGRKSEQIAAEILEKIDTDTAWASEKAKRDAYRIHPLYAYLNAEDTEGFKRFLSSLGEVKGTERIHFATAAYVRQLVKKGIDLDFAGELIQKERGWAKNKMLEANQASEDRTKYEGQTFGYAMFTADYAQLLYKKGEKAKSFDLYKEAMKYNQHRKEAELTNAYLVVASEMLPQDVLNKEMETLIRNGMATAEIINRLKTVYVNKTGSDAGFENYIASFNKDKIKEKIESLRKIMLDETAPGFTLKDLNGNIINLTDLNGKIVVLDFWATWCGPCKAAFPAMQAMVDKYKGDPNVRFFFIDTYERGDSKEKNASDYINGKKYTFTVLMDNFNEVAQAYKAKNIPAKFVIDRNGKLRFKAAGFSSDADLMEEIEAMVTLAKEK